MSTTKRQKHDETHHRAMALLLVDMSVEQVASLSSQQKRRIVTAVHTLAALPGWTLRLDSRLWLSSPDESTLSWVYPEWGDTMGVPNSPGAALIPELRFGGDNNNNNNEDHSWNWEFVEKKHYSSFVDSRLLEILRDNLITDLFIAGINTDYCIFDTAMDSFARGRFHTWVVEEAVGSVSGTAGHKQGLSWVRAHMGPGTVVSLEEAVDKVSKQATTTIT